MFASVRGVRVGVLSCLAAVSVLACGPDSETASPAAVNAPEVGGVAPDSLGDRPELPPELPGDVPRYPGAVPTRAIDDGSQMLASFETPDDLQTVAERLKRDFIAGGWSAEVSIHDEGGVVSAGKESREVTVTLSVSSGGTLIDFFVFGGG